MTRQKYIPDQGDIIWINFNPIRGHEQKGKRPALVISPKSYNFKSGLALVCPITSQGKDYPFDVFCESRSISGFVMTDHIRSVDWAERKVRFADTASSNTLREVVDKIKLIIE